MELNLRKPVTQPVSEPKPENTLVGTEPAESVKRVEFRTDPLPPFKDGELLSAFVPDYPVPTPTGFLARLWAQLSTNSNPLIRIIVGLLIGFLIFYNVADYCGFTGSQLRPGEMIYSNTMVQLWTATYRIIYIVAFCFALISLVFVGLWQFFKPSSDQSFDLTLAIRNHLTPEKQIWLFFAVFFALAFLFVMLLGVKLPESPSVLR